jgi:ribonuclease T2
LFRRSIIEPDQSMGRLVPLALVLLALSVARVAADVRLDGTFTAREACPAFQSIRNETNPGSIHLETGKSYPLRAKNKPDASHYQIEVADAEPRRRWVAIGCGEVEDTSAGSASGGSGGAPAGAGTGLRKAEYILAVSWQPAFCETAAGRRKTECGTQSADRFDASHFTLHGLWPQGRSYCRVPADVVATDKASKTDPDAWQRLPPVSLAPGTRRELERVMPGTMSQLDRHEWIKHGTCFGDASADAYFARAIALLDQLNQSRARGLFARSVGHEITREAIRQAFDESFGSGAGDRVVVECNDDGGRRLIAELTIGLVGAIGDAPTLAPLMAASAPPRDPGCPAGLVDPVGLQ